MRSTHVGCLYTDLQSHAASQAHVSRYHRCDNRQRYLQFEAHVQAKNVQGAGISSGEGEDARFRLMANAAPILMWMASPDGHCFFFNDSWLRFRGRTLDQEAADNWAGIHADDLARCQSVYGEAFAARRPFEMDYRLRRHDGEYRWVYDSAAPMYDDGGGFAGFAGACIDITSRRQADDEKSALALELALSLDEMRTLLDVIPIGIGIADDAACTVIRVNPAFARHLRVTPAQNASKTAPGADELPFRVMRDGREVSPRDLPMQRAAKARETIAEEEYDVVYADGSSVTLLEYAAPLLDADGDVRGAIGAFVDVTAMRRAQDTQAFLARASEILGASNAYEQTLQDVAMLFVPRFADWCTMDVAEADGLRTLAVAHADAQKLEVAHRMIRRYPARGDERIGVPHVLRSGRSVLVEHVGDAEFVSASHDEEHLRVLRAGGFRSYICVPMMARGRALGTITFVSAETGRIFDRRDLAFAEDLGRRVAVAIDNSRLLREAQETAAELREASAAKDEFLGLISHELRTPITTIFGNAQVLRRHGERVTVEDRAAALSDIEQETDRLQRIIDNLLVLARMQAGQQVPTEPVLLGYLIGRLASKHLERFPARAVDVSVPEGLPPVEAEAVYVEQVLANLLSNAEKYSPAGQPIAIEAFVADDGVSVSVLDRGAGLGEGEHEQVFSPFYRSERTRAQASGAGMGLAVCRRLIEAQGGTIGAKSRSGGGAAFTFTLPIAKEIHS